MVLLVQSRRAAWLKLTYRWTLYEMKQNDAWQFDWQLIERVNERKSNIFKRNEALPRQTRSRLHYVISNSIIFLEAELRQLIFTGLSRLINIYHYVNRVFLRFRVLQIFQIEPRHSTETTRLILMSMRYVTQCVSHWCPFTSSIEKRVW